MTESLIQKPHRMQLQIAGGSLDLIVLDYCDVTVMFSEQLHAPNGISDTKWGVIRALQSCHEHAAQGL